MLAEVSPFINSLQHIIGFLVVILALGLLWAVTALLGTYFKRRPQPAAATKSAPKADADPSQPTDEELVAITAAVSLLMGRRSRIVSLGTSKKDWSREGLREHFASHRIR